MEEITDVSVTTYDHLNVKTGTDLESDIERVRSVTAGAPDAKLTVDTNQGWTVSETVRFLDQLRDHGISLELLEQPVHRSGSA